MLGDKSCPLGLRAERNLSIIISKSVSTYKQLAICKNILSVSFRVPPLGRHQLASLADAPSP
jgi:hypothetical protein